MTASSLSRKILIGILVMFILSLFGVGGYLSQYLVLYPYDVVPGLQLWRLVTYPIGVEFLGLLIGSICFSAPGEEIEGMIGTRRFGILLLAVTLTAGLMHLMLFLGEGTPVLEGPINPALFVLVGFVYLFPQSEVRILFFSVRSWTVLAFSAALILFFTIYRTLNGASPWLFFSMGGYGLLLGALYFHIRYQKYAVLLRPIRSMERLVAGGRHPGGLSPSAGGQKRVQVSQAARIRIPFQKSAPRELSDEERLNMILDRINEASYSALSDDDKRFLAEYSNRM